MVAGDSITLSGDSLKAGRELDALVAEKVMGAIVEWWNGEPLCVTVLDGHKRSSSHLADYSTNIAAAWEVVEKMAQGWDFYLRFVSAWTAEFVTIGGGDCETADADAAPLAICLAALKAVA